VSSPAKAKVGIIGQVIADSEMRRRAADPLATVDCQRPGCKEEAAARDIVCRFHRGVIDAEQRRGRQVDLEAETEKNSESHDLPEVAAGFLTDSSEIAAGDPSPIKIAALMPPCKNHVDRLAEAARGPYAYLCAECVEEKKQAHGARTSRGMEAAGIGEGAKAGAAVSPLEVVKQLRQAAFTLEKAQERFDTAKADLNRARRTWQRALDDAKAGV
jgi:predicted transcriptional regulator